MKVSDVMSTDLEFASGDDSVRSLAEMMGELDVGSVPVGTPSEPLGIVTDRDILYRVVSKGLDPATTTVREILSAPLLTCEEDDALQRAMDLMAAHHVRRLGVRRRDGTVAGWLTLADVSRKLLLESDTMRGALTELSSESA